MLYHDFDDLASLKWKLERIDAEIEHYEAYVKKAMPGLNSRNQYRDCIVYLKKLSTYPEGLDMDRKIAQEWRKTYRNRRAMRDELSKAGF